MYSALTRHSCLTPYLVTNQRTTTLVGALLLVFFSALSASVDARETAYNDRSFARVDALLEKQIEQERLAGAVVRILHKGRVVKSTAYGMQDREQDLTMAEDSIFRIASQTKALVSVAVLMLQERGLLLIGDPISNYLPEFTNTTVAVEDETKTAGYAIVPVARPITIRDLLTHTAGLGYGGGPAAQLWEQAGIQGWYFAGRQEPVRETVRRLAALPFDAQPGEAFVYGYSTDVLGALVEVASGQPLDEFLQQHLFEPLDMRDTHFYLPQAKAARLVSVYGLADSGDLVRAPDTSDMVGQGEYVTGPRVSFSGGAGLLSTARDYARFLEALRNNGKLGRVRILSRKSVELMTANHIGALRLRPGVAFGLGLSVITDLGARGELGSAGELGWGGAYHTSYWIDPAEELVVVYMTQLRPARGANDHTGLRAAIYSSLY